MVVMGASAEGILEGLDDAQRAAAVALDGGVRIVAGAGAGKTRTVTRRIAYACASGEWDPTRTLAVTFSVKAAAEMRSRLGMLGVEGVRAATFHSAALRQLRRVWDDVCDAPFPHVVDEGDTGRLVATALRRTVGGDEPDRIAVRDVLAEINWAKVSLIAPGDYARVCAATGRRPPAGLDPDRFADVYEGYEREKTAHGLIDFDDILLVCCHVMEGFDEAATRIRSSIRWLTVDEYQDVSPLQHRLMTLWLDGNRDVCVVGDPAQTIYSFAGASSYDLLSFAGQFGPLHADIALNTDYRSTPQVVAYANKVLSRSPERADYLKLTSAREPGARVAHTVYATDRDEARGVAGRIARMVAGGVDPADCAILTRVNAQQPMLRAALHEVGLRSRIRRDAGWSGGTAATLAAVGLPAAETTGGAPAAAPVARGEVTISTIHASKGLEFPHVFLVGCSEGLIPYGSPGDGDQLEEERRLLYVGVTRAEDTLHLSYARSREGLNVGRGRTPSRFL